MRAFEVFLRTGRIVPDAEKLEHKFNPLHDPDDGRFTFAGQGRRFGGEFAAATGVVAAGQAVRGRRGSGGSIRRTPLITRFIRQGEETRCRASHPRDAGSLRET